MIRVKLYVLNENRQWDDKGKGYVSVVARQPNAPELVSSITKTESSSPECANEESSDDFFKNDDPDLNNINTDDEDLVENDENASLPTSIEKATDSSKDSCDSDPETSVDPDDQSVDIDAGSPSAKIAKLVNETCPPAKKEMMIVMKSEADPNVTLLCSKIQADTLYQKQQDTLIVWNSETEGDLALSFEEIKGCTTIHEQIWAYQNEISDGSADDSCSDPTTPGDHFGSSSGLSLPVEAGGGWISLPGDGTSDGEGNSLSGNLAGGAARNGSLPGAAGNMDVWMSLLDIGKLDTLRCYIARHMMIAKFKESFVDIIESERLIPKMIDLFKKCEDLDNLPGLHNLYSIFKNLISLGKTTVFEILFSPEHIDDVIGILEYVPDKPRQYHRQFIANATLKEALPIKKPNLLQKIRQTYKVQYIHDVIIPTPPIMEEMNLYTMQSFIYVNKAEIVTMIKEDTPFLKAIIAQIMKDDSSYEEKKNSFGFFKELCAYSQCLDAVMRETFFFDNVELGILKAISHILAIDIDETASQKEIDDTVELQWSAVEVLAYFIEVCPIVVRDFVMEDHKKNLTSDETLLINLLLVQMLNDRDPELGRALQVLNLFPILLDFSIDTEEVAVSRHILDPLHYKKQLDIKDSFLSMFYSRSVPILISPLLSMTSADEPTETLCRDDYRSALLAQVVLRLLIYCLSHGHGFHIRTYLLKNELIGRFMQLMKSKHTFLVLTALKFLRAIIGLKDDVFTRIIVGNKLLQPVVDCFVRNGNKYNLLNSALIEFFDFIRSENIKLLIQNFGDLYLAQFQDVQYVSTFKDLKIRYSQLVEYEKNSCNVNLPGSVGTSLIGTDYSSDSEGSSMSEKSTLSFLSPTVLMDNSSSPTGGSSAKGATRSSVGGPLVSSILEYDWLNSEDDDDDDAMPNQSEQLLADDNMIDDAKWTEQWDFHTSQLQKKRLQKQQSETESSPSGVSPIFEPVLGKKTPALGKKSATGPVELKSIAANSNNGGTTFNIKPIRKFPETLASVASSDVVAENGSPDEAASTSASNPSDGVENGKTVNASLNLDATAQNKLMVAPPPRSSTPNSLVDYDSDSDEDETKSEENIAERNSEDQDDSKLPEEAKVSGTNTEVETSECENAVSSDETHRLISSEKEESDTTDSKCNKRQLDADDDENCFETSSHSDQNSGHQASISPPRKRNKSIEDSVAALDEV